MENENIKLFFTDPKNGVHGEKYSVLYLLRRDIVQCLGNDPSSGRKIECKVLWPGAMTIFAGIDLLAKFYEGDDEIKNGISERFKLYLRENFDGLSDNSIDIIWEVRNSMMHSFGLYSKFSDHKIRVVNNNQENLVENIKDDKIYSLDIGLLHKEFEKSIEEYRKNLMQSDELMRKFNLIFNRYGFIYIRNNHMKDNDKEVKGICIFPCFNIHNRDKTSHQMALESWKFK